MTSIIIAIAGLSVGFTVGYLLMSVRSMKERTCLVSARDTLKTQAEDLQRQKEEYKAEAECKLSEAKEEAVRQLSEVKEEYIGQLTQTKAEAERKLSEAKEEAATLLTQTKAEAERKLSEAKEEYATLLTQAKAEAEHKLSEAKEEAAALLAQTKAEAERKLSEAKEEYAALLAQTKAEAEKQRREVEERYSRQLADFRQQQKELHDRQQEQQDRQSQLIREQINSASEQILKRRSEELSANNREQLATILNPLQENLRQMREAVDKSGREQAISMERLDQSIKENLKQAHEVGQSADRLAQALTSENKVQGDFGELRLRTLLENMGLEEGVQFEEQVTLRDDQGNTLFGEGGSRMIPDVILHFPDNRDVIIDSKMSLKAFEDYFNDTGDAVRQEQDLRRHIASVRQHVKELAHKNYSSYLRNGSNRLDFVVMYIYSESAVQLALVNDPTLWKEAYDQGVIISGSQTLYMMLRVLEMTWRQVRQAENQDKIMTAADELINRVQMFYERFQSADEQLGKTQRAFDTLRAITAPTGISIATSANKLLKFGAKENAKRKSKLPRPTNDEDGLAQ